MPDNDLIKTYFEKEYGLRIQPSTEKYPLVNYTRIDDDSIARVNSLFGDVPFITAQLRAEQEMTGAYKVIFDRGIGTLQQSGLNPDRLRANVVAFGSNNKIVGQAELEKFHLNISTPALAVFEITSIMTSQYYLARIDKKLSALYREIQNIERMFENSKESDLCSHERYLQSVSGNLTNILRNTDYRKSTLNIVQGNRMNALSLVEYYNRERINVLNEWLEHRSKKAAYTQEFLDKYQRKLDLYNRAIYVYSVAYVLEVILSQITSTDTINLIEDEIITVVNDYNQKYAEYFSRFCDQVTNTDENILKGLGKNMLGGAALGAVAGFVGIATLPVTGVIAGTFLAGNMLKDKKTEKVVLQLGEGLSAIEESNPCNNIVEESILALERLNCIYNNKVELLVKDDKMYVRI